jgi:hypothetical protein
MLLAMVVTVIGGVFVLLGPFLNDINDNREWSAGSVAATQLNDRILIAAQSPEGAGLVHQNAQLARTIDSLRDAEMWEIQADLGGSDRTVVVLDGDLINVTSTNRTALTVTATGDNVNETWTLTNGTGDHTVLNLSGTIIIDIVDIHGVHSHRFVQISIDGLRLNNPLTTGAFTVDLVNGARVEKLPTDAIEVRQFPRLEHDLLLDGTPRVNLILLDIDISASAKRHMTNIHLDSNGEVELFDGTARNLVIVIDVAGDPSIMPQYIHHWTGDHALYLASGHVEDYRGFGPHARLSGFDGITIMPSDVPLELHVALQSVEVS